MPASPVGCGSWFSPGTSTGGTGVKEMMKCGEGRQCPPWICSVGAQYTQVGTFLSRAEQGAEF